MPAIGSGKLTHKSFARAVGVLRQIIGTGFAAVGLSFLSMAASSSSAVGEHVIAAVATKSSPHQPYGAEVLAGAMAAAEKINAAGGVLGEAIRVVGWSEDCSRERAVQIAEEIARLKPAVVIGHLCASAAMAAAAIYRKAGVLLIAPGVRHPGLTNAAGGGDLVLRLAGRDDRFASEVAGFIAGRFPGEGVAIVADRTRQARGLAKAMSSELAKKGIAVKLDERIESSEKSYVGTANRVKSSGARVVVMPAQPIELGILVADLRRIGVRAPIVGSEILAVPSLIPTARREADRLVVMLPWTGLETGKRVTLATGDGLADVSRNAVWSQSHAALEVWAAAATRAGTREAAPVARAMRAAAAVTAVGTVRFDAEGDATVPSYVPHFWSEEAWRPLDR